MRRAGLNKRFLSIDNGKTMFCYCEKGTKVAKQSSIVFIHGFSGDKYAWLNIIKVSNYFSTWER
jgi:pimeloyl-ACP methyl ester carboxylesterase